MKADHRKELQTNLLADRMGRLVQGFKSGPRSTSAFGWVIGLLVVAIIVGWYFARGSRAGRSEEWVELDNPFNTPSAYDKIARDHPGTIPARTARFQKAHILLRNGLTNLYSPNPRRQAVKDARDARDDLRDARDLFKNLIAECQGNAILEQEALFSAARAEEALAAVTESPDSDQKVGSLDRALAYYQRLASSYPETEEGQRAKKRVEELQNETKRAQIEKFYAALADDLKRQASFTHPDLGDSSMSDPTP